MTRPPDMDRGLRLAARGLALLLLSGLAVPFLTGTTWGGRFRFVMEEMPWSYAARWGWHGYLLWLAPPVLGAWTLWRTRRGGPGLAGSYLVILTVVFLAAMATAAPYFQGARRIVGLRNGHAVPALLAMLAAVSTVALASQRARRVEPEASAPRALGALSGGLLLFVMMVPMAGGQPLLFWIFESGTWRHSAVVGVFLVVMVGLAGLAILGSTSVRGSGSARQVLRALSWVAALAWIPLYLWIRSQRGLGTWDGNALGFSLRLGILIAAPLTLWALAFSAWLVAHSRAARSRFAGVFGEHADIDRPR